MNNLQLEHDELIAHIDSLNKLILDHPNLLPEYKEQLEREIRFKTGILTHYQVTLKLQKEEHGK